MSWLKKIFDSIRGLFGTKVETASPVLTTPEAQPPAVATPAPIDVPKPAPSVSAEQKLRDALVAHAMKDVGVVRETGGPNRSPRIDYINTQMGVSIGSSYCIGAQYVNLDETCKAFGLKNPVFKTASTQEFINHKSVQKYKRPAGTLGKKGDWASFQHEQKPANGHEAMLRENQAAHPTFNTVEYNTNKLGSRNGDGCWTQQRSEHTSLSGLKFQAFVDVVQWVLDANPNFK